MFIALKGETFNGNAFAAQALAQGCRYAVVDEPEYAQSGSCVLVDDCLKALQQLANYHRRQLKTPILGITGTNGKTTTKELVSSVLSKKYNTLFTQGNLNNHIGVPLTLLRLTKEHEMAVVEMGANHPGEIKALVHIAEPDYGLITNVGKAHLLGFGSFEGVIRTKGELYDYLRGKGDATIFIQNENPYLNGIAHDLNCIRYGQAPGLFVSGKLLSCSPFLAFEWTSEGNTYPVQTHLIGAYNLDNALAAVAVGRYFDVASEDICQALSEYVPQNNRSQLVDTGRNKLIVDAYNANPTSMMAALENFRQMDAPHKMVILGDMRELGDYAGQEHEVVITRLLHTQQTNTDALLTCYLVGSEFGKAWEAVQAKMEEEGDTAASHSCIKTFPDAQSLLEALQNGAISIRQAQVLIKGSRGMALETLYSAL